MARQRQPTDPRTIAENIISDHGKAGFQTLIEMFRANESGTKIGYVFGVTRQRVNQWKTALGEERVTFVVDPAVEDLLDIPVPRGTRRTAI